MGGIFYIECLVLLQGDNVLANCPKTKILVPNHGNRIRSLTVTLQMQRINQKALSTCVHSLVNCSEITVPILAGS
jgi:hypothetical protein